MQKERPVGPIVPDWTPPPVPNVTELDGQYSRLERFHSDSHASALYQSFSGHDWVWDYMPNEPFASAAQFHRWAREAEAMKDILFYAIFDKDRKAYGGFASYLRIKPASGSIEVGYIAMAPSLQRTRAATEAMFLMMQWAFDAGYRRYEWKCDALNMPSRRAAQRFGFSYEGVFDQATIIKGRNRDTAWFAVLDCEWSELKAAFQSWLHPTNFDGTGRQRQRLADLTSLVRRNHDPLQGV